MATTKQEVPQGSQLTDEEIEQEIAAGNIVMEDEPTPALPVPVMVTPADMITHAMAKGASLEEIRGYYELQKEWLADEAKKAYVRAMTAFKQDVTELPKNTHVKYKNKDGTFTEYWHCSLSDMTEILGEALGKVGISFTWQTKQVEGGVIHVTCKLTHVDGHEEITTLFGSPDQSGGKNNIQAVGSTTTYLKRYTLSTITGTAESTEDDDGKGGEKDETEPELITPEQVAEIIKYVEENKMKMEAVLKLAESGTGQPTLESIRAVDLPRFMGHLAKKVSK